MGVSLGKLRFGLDSNCKFIYHLVTDQPAGMNVVICPGVQIRGYLKLRAKTNLKKDGNFWSPQRSMGLFLDGVQSKHP